MLKTLKKITQKIKHKDNKSVIEEQQDARGVVAEVPSAFTSEPQEHKPAKGHSHPTEASNQSFNVSYTDAVYGLQRSAASDSQNPAEALDYTHDEPLEGCLDYGAEQWEMEDLTSRSDSQSGAGIAPRSDHEYDVGAAADHSGTEQCSVDNPEGASTPESAAEQEHLSDISQGLGNTESAVRGDGLEPDPPASDPLQNMVYLTDEEDTGDDAISVLSDGMTEEQIAEELSELEEALSALEGEALFGQSPGAPASGAQLDKELAEKLGVGHDDSSDPSAYARQMVKLYTNLGLKLMDSRKFEDALTLLRKAEALVENDAMWGGAAELLPNRRDRFRAIAYNNLGCLFKRRGMPQQSLQYLSKALAVVERTGHVQNCSSTHLNICAAYSSLKKHKEALGHAERAIMLLQRQLWSPLVSFHEGLQQLCKVVSTAGSKQLLSGVNVLAIAYHNAGLEQERLGRVREAHVCFSRASTLSLKCFGPRAALTLSLQKALKGFLGRHQLGRGRGGTAGVGRVSSGGGSGQVKVRHSSPKSKSGSRTAARPPHTARTVTSRSALAASSAKGIPTSAVAKAVLPLDKGKPSGRDPRLPPAGKLAEKR